jgi:deoxyribodipyrimidine photolyase
MADPSLVWLRQDLRLEDQPAIAAAAAGSGMEPYQAVIVATGML